MYRFTVLVDKKIKEQATDPAISGFLEEAGEDTFLVNRDSCIESYRPWFAHNKEYLAERIYRECIENKYLLPKKGAVPQITLNYKHGGGADLIEGYGWGFARELISKEWKFISLFFLIVGYVVGKYAG